MNSKAEAFRHAFRLGQNVVSPRRLRWQVDAQWKRSLYLDDVNGVDLGLTAPSRLTRQAQCVLVGGRAVHWYQDPTCFDHVRPSNWRQPTRALGARVGVPRDCSHRKGRAGTRSQTALLAGL